MSSAERAGLRPKGNVPTLRFPEFTDEWISCKVGDYGKIITGSTPPTSDNTNYADGTHLWASPVDLGQTKYVIDTQTKLSSIGFGKTRKLPAGSVLVTCIGSTIGKTGMAATEMSTNQQINSIVVNAQNDKHFVYYALQSRFPRYLTSVAVQAVPIMSKSSFEKLQNYRTTFKEQKKIGALLNLIDERISTQSRIIEELKLYRNTLVFRLLTPKDKWLRLSIGDVAHVIGGGTPDTNIEDYWNGNIQWYTPSEIGKKKYVTESERTLTQKGLDNSSAKLLPPNTILLSTRATIGECSIAKQECCTNQGFQSLIATSVTPEFLYYLIQTKRRDLLSKASGSTFAEISANEVRRIHICIPATATEQEIIVRPLSAYDEKIETEYKMLHLFKMQKQYLLSHMFI